MIAIGELASELGGGASSESACNDGSVSSRDPLRLERRATGAVGSELGGASSESTFKDGSVSSPRDPFEDEEEEEEEEIIG
jgi:hypothetical protein